MSKLNLPAMLSDVKCVTVCSSLFYPSDFGFKSILDKNGHGKHIDRSTG